MASLRGEIPADFDGHKIVEFRDYKIELIKDMESGKERNTGLPKSDVLYYIFEDGTHVAIRPSGTEPKVKVYFMASGENRFDCHSKIETYEAIFGNLLK